MANVLYCVCVCLAYFGSVSEVFEVDWASRFEAGLRNAVGRPDPPPPQTHGGGSGRIAGKSASPASTCRNGTPGRATMAAVGFGTADGSRARSSRRSAGGPCAVQGRAPTATAGGSAPCAPATGTSGNGWCGKTSQSPPASGSLRTPMRRRGPRGAGCKCLPEPSIRGRGMDRGVGVREYPGCATREPPSDGQATVATMVRPPGKAFPGARRFSKLAECPRGDVIPGPAGPAMAHPWFLSLV